MTIGYILLTEEDRAILRNQPTANLWADTRDYSLILDKEVRKAGLVSVPCCETCGSEEVVADGPCRWDAKAQRWENVDIYDNSSWCDECGFETDLAFRYRALDAEPFKGDDKRREATIATWKGGAS